MAFCTECGAKIPDGAKFCPNCGSRVYEKANEESGAETPQSINKDDISNTRTSVSAGAEQYADHQQSNEAQKPLQKGRRKPFLIVAAVIVAVAIGIVMWFNSQNKTEGPFTKKESYDIGVSIAQKNIGQSVGIDVYKMKFCDIDEAIIEVVDGYYYVSGWVSTDGSGALATRSTWGTSFKPIKRIEKLQLEYDDLLSRKTELNNIEKRRLEILDDMLSKPDEIEDVWEYTDELFTIQ